MSLDSNTLASLMAQAINEHNKNVVAEVERVGEKIIIPKNMKLGDAITNLQRRQQEEEMQMQVNRTFSAFPNEGAMALETAVKEVTGWMTSRGTPNWFGEDPPSTITIPIGVDKTRDVIWGRIQIDEDGSFLETGFNRDSKGVFTFQVTGIIRRKHKYLVDKILDRTAKILKEKPFYKGAALAVSFRDRSGKLLSMPEMKFYNYESNEVDNLVFSRNIEQALGANVLAPIQNPAACEAVGIPFKRGILLAGKYGTGKTLYARKIAREAGRHGVTFIYINNVSELPDALNFARNYEPAVIFAEDVDRAVSGQTRTADIDKVLNTLDGIDSKNTRVMTVLTTNHVEDINTAMLRPGRIDALIEVLPPDAEAAARLIRVYGGELIAEGDLRSVAKALEGMIPAVIREIVERSKLVYIWRTSCAPGKASITEDDLLGAVDAIKPQLAILNNVDEDDSDEDDLIRGAKLLAAAIGNREYNKGWDDGLSGESHRDLAVEG